MAFALTETGIQEAEAVLQHGKRDSEIAVITLMYRKGETPVELDDIMSDTRMNLEKATNVVQRLINAGYVEEI